MARRFTYWQRTSRVGNRLLLLLAIIGVASALFACSPGETSQNNFVTRSGAQLLLHGQPFRLAGANIYWLGLDENVGGVAYPSHFRVDDAFATMADMGTTVVRSHTLGISTGCRLCLEPSLGQFNQTAFASIDYAIWSASAHHIRLVIPLTDNWHYYHGGKHTFTDWRGISDENAFYTNKTVIHDFEQYISELLNHINSYTGIAYKDDPTIMAWETGNELTPPSSWTNTISTFIKSTDSHHLVIDGSSAVNPDALALPNVDIYTTHYYPMNITQMQKDAKRVIEAKKVFYVGEYGWESGASLKAFLTAIEKSKVAGDTYWSFFPHNDTYGYVQHSDGYMLHYPGDNSAMQSAVQMLRAHAYRMQGRSEPSPGIPDAPLITGIQGRQIIWRGTALGATYSLERSSAGANGPWIVICNRCATDNSTPWTDTTQPSGLLWYRVKAFNLAGRASSYSAPYALT